MTWRSRSGSSSTTSRTAGSRRPTSTSSPAPAAGARPAALARGGLAQAHPALPLAPRARAGQESAERRLLLGADRAVEARDHAGRLAERADVLGVEVRAGGDLVVRGLAAELRAQLADGAGDLPLALGDVRRHADRAALGVEPALDGLADPERRVGGEPVALAPVELLDGADEAEDALLDQVEQAELVALVLAGDGDDEAEVRADHALLGLEIAALDPPGELDLLVGAEQPVSARLVQEELKRVRGLDGELGGREGDRPGVRAAVVLHLDTPLLELVVDLGEAVTGEAGLLGGLVDLGGRDRRLVLAGAVEEVGDARWQVRRTHRRGFAAPDTVKTSGGASGRERTHRHGARPVREEPQGERRARAARENGLQIVQRGEESDRRRDLEIGRIRGVTAERAVGDPAVDA